MTIERDQATTNVQSATAEQMQETQALNLTDFMRGTMQSVSTNDYTGNPYQQDLVFRGFAASPLIGTPQGLSVYLDGVRVNEPFGEVVNWDMLPVNAIKRMELMPGSDPLFGLNTLGGALAISTKDGFSTQKAEASVLTGSWGRRQTQASVGGNNGKLAGFLALNYFDEEGWRDNSPSAVRQAYGRADYRGDRKSGGVSVLHASNKLVGNGLVPLEQYRVRPESVFTSPDRSENELMHYTGNFRLDLTDTTALSALAYHRRVKQDSIGGDYWDEFRTAASRLRPNCGNATYPSMTSDGAIGVDLPGCANLLPNGIFNMGHTSQNANGASLQLNWVGETHQLVGGAAYDENDVSFRQGQRLGFISDSREILLRPDRFNANDIGLTPLVAEVQRNDLSGGAKTFSLFAKEIWSIRPNLHLSGGLRYSRTNVTNQLVSDRPIPLYQFDETLAQRLQNRCGAENGDVNARFYCTSGDYTYWSLNPSLGLSWLPREDFNVYSNFSRGSRVPSTIELGCARDREAERLAGGGGQNTGKTPGCSVPTALTSDPYLPQVTSYTYEAGLRGSLTPEILWNASVYRTDLHDDILFVSLGSRNRGVFDTFGRTRRQGFEMGLQGEAGRHTFRASWSRVDATFQSPAEVVNLSNSTSTKTSGQVNTFRIDPGDRIPGIPRDAARLSWGYRVTDDWRFALTMIAHSWSYARGNENNAHTPGGTDTNGSATQGTIDPTITTEPGRRYVGSGRIPGYAIFNFTSSLKLSSRLTVTLRIDNLFDRRYVTAGELALNPFSASRWGAVDGAGFNYNSNDWTHSTLVGPGAPRALWIGVTYAMDTGAGAK